MIFDTHAHYDDEAFGEDREELLSSLPEAGIKAVVNVGASLESTERSLGLAARYPFVYAAVGVHPSECGEMKEEDIRWLKKASAEEKAVAVGEIGLDYYWHRDPESHALQMEWFQRQMELAREEGLPFIIHSREAAADTLEAVKRLRAWEIGGVIHCFSYSREMADEYLKMGLYLGIGGVVTFKNARRLKEAVAEAPLKQLLLETDSPYLAPEPNRGKRNSSLNLPYVAEEIARLKGVTPEEVIAVTEENARRLFRKIRA